MRRSLVTAAVLACAAPAFAGPAQKACLATERSPGPRVCACAQQVADQTLSRSDQHIAASIIREPELFVKYQKDSSRRAQGFLTRYRLWGERVEQHCARR